MEGPKFLGKGIVVVADEGEDTADAVDGGGCGLPCCRFSLSSLAGWAESAAAEGGDVDPQLRRQILEVGEHGLGLAQLLLCGAAADLGAERLRPPGPTTRVNGLRHMGRAQ